MTDSASQPAQGPSEEPAADVRPLPVLAQARPIERPSAGSGLAVPAAAAATGIVAGVATFVLMRVLRRVTAPGWRLRRRARKAGAIEVVTSRSFLVDVHLLKK